MISLIHPLAIGNALKLIITPPAGVELWRVLRNTSGSFSGPDDEYSLVVYEGDDKVFIDSAFMQNDTPYQYQVFYFDGSGWAAGNVASGTPRADYVDHSVNALDILRERIEYGMQEEVKRGSFRPSSGFIPVLTAPPVFEDARWPMVSVHQLDSSPVERGIGEVIGWDDNSIDGDLALEGWLAREQVAVIGWSLNPDERIELRKALRRIIIANLELFDDAGVSQVEFSIQDSDAISGEYPAPVYQAAGTFTCLVPNEVGGQVPFIREVISRSNIDGD